MPASKEDEEYLEFLSGTDTDVEITSGGCKQHLAGGDAAEAALLHLHRVGMLRTTRFQRGAAGGSFTAGRAMDCRMLGEERGKLWAAAQG